MSENNHSGKKPHATKNKSSQSPYHESSDLLNRIFNKMESSSKSKNCSYNQLLKSSITNKEGKLQVSSKTYAIVTKVLQNKSKIDTLITGTNILTDSHPIKNMGLFYIMIYELLFASSSLPQQRKTGTNKIKGGGLVKRYILQYETILRNKYQEYYGSTTNNQDENQTDDHHHNHRPFQHRYVRVNTCVTSVHDFLQFYSTMLTNADHEGSTTSAIGERIYRDQHVPDLLVIPAHGTSQLLSTLQNQNKGNHIVLQDKSSCIPAVCLYSLLRQRQPQERKKNHNPLVNQTINVLDACAAPGNKTSHIAAVLQQLRPQRQHHHRIYAMDRDQERCQTLQDRMKLLVPSNSSSSSGSTTPSCPSGGNIDVIVEHKDFLTISGSDEHNDEYKDLTCIVLDPSCSGSGLYHRNSMGDHMNMEYSSSIDSIDQQQKHRIQKLSNFQITCLRHALTSFPNVHTVIYSTCSVHVLENEHVVASVLSNTCHDDDNSSLNLRDEWSIVAPPDLQDWPRRGMNIRQTRMSENGDDDDAADGNIVPDDPECDQNVNDLFGDLTEEEMNCFIRTAYEDRTNGFFVACFQRTNILGLPEKKQARSTASGTSTTPPGKQGEWNLLPTYHGEFDQMIKSDVVVSNHGGKRKSLTMNDTKAHGNDHRTSRTTVDTSNVSDEPLVSNQSKKRKVDTKKAGPASTTTTTTPSSEAVPNSKKRTKKLEWKQRQHEAKLLRTKGETKNKKS